MIYKNNSDNKLSSCPLPEDKEEIISLWQIVFQDSDEYVDLFFSRVYKPENTLIIKSDDKIVSALQMIPYEIKTPDGIIPSVYICGVCTHPLERGKGFMNILMCEAMKKIQQERYGIATLIPAHTWLFDIYKKYGFIYPINYSIETYTDGALPTLQDNTDTTGKFADAYNPDPHYSPHDFIPYSEDHFLYFDKKQRERQCAILHNAYDLDNIISDLKNNNGNAWVSLENNKPVGIAFAKPLSENFVTIKEILYDNTHIKESLIRYILNIYNAKNAEVRIPANSKKTYPYGLAYIHDKRITNLPDTYMTLMLD